MEMTKALERLNTAHQKALQQADTDLMGIISSEEYRRRYLSVLVVQIARSEALQRCTPASLTTAIMDMAILGLDPVLKEAWIIPYKNTATFQTGYPGKIKLALNHPEVLDVYAEMVCEGETFVYKGEHDRPEHSISNPFASRARNALGFYAVAKLRGKDGEPRWRCLVMGRDAVRQHARRYSRGYYRQIRDGSKPQPATCDPETNKPMNDFWVDNAAGGNFNEMGIVTVLRRLLDPKHGIPMTAKAYDHLQHEAEREGLIPGDPDADRLKRVGDDRTDDEVQTRFTANVADLFGDVVNPTAHDKDQGETKGEILSQIAAYCKSLRVPLQEFWTPHLRTHQVTAANKIPLEGLQAIRDGLGQEQAKTPDIPLTLEGHALIEALQSMIEALNEDDTEAGMFHVDGCQAWINTAKEHPLTGEEITQANAALKAARDYL